MYTTLVVAALTQAALAESTPEYLKTSRNVAECPDGYEKLKSSAECRTACKELGWARDVHGDRNGQYMYPTGCIENGLYCYYNSHTDNRPHRQRGVVCRKIPTSAPTPVPTPAPTTDQFCPPIPDAHGPWCWNMLTPPVWTEKTEAECKDLCRDNPECQYALTGPGWCQNCKHSPFPIKATLPGSSQQYMHPKKTSSPNGECQESPFCNRIPDAHGPWCSNILSPPVATDKSETECKAMCAANPRCRYALTGPEWCQNCAHSPFPTKPTLPGSKQAFMHPKKQFSPNGQCE